MLRTSGTSLLLALVAITVACREEQQVIHAKGANPLVHLVPQNVPLKLALVTNARTPFWNLAQKGVVKFEQESGTKVELFIPQNGRMEEQKQILDELASKGYHGVMISVVKPAEQVPILNQLADRMNLITVDSDAPLSQRLAFVGPNQQDAGVAAGMAIVRLLPRGGKVAVFAGEMTAENVVARLRGIKSTIEGRNIEIVSLKEDRASRTKAKEQVQEVLNVTTNLDLLVGLWSYNGPVIRDVLKERGLAGRIKVVAFDEEEGTLQGIEEGTIDSSVALTPFDFGYLGARLLHDLARKGESAIPPNNEINTGFILITRFNLKEFRENLARQNSY
jgi:ribose transport system substrate-binding protein